MSNLEEAWRQYREAKAAMEAAWRRYESLRIVEERRIRIPPVAPKQPKKAVPKVKREPPPKFELV